MGPADRKRAQRRELKNALTTLYNALHSKSVRTRAWARGLLDQISPPKPKTDTEKAEGENP